jgi:perosamine synthetase
MNGVVIDKEKFGFSRNELMAKLKEEGIDTRYFFRGMHEQPSLIKYGCDSASDYKVTNWLAENGLYLPSGSNLRKDQIEFIANNIRQIHEQ